MSSLAYALEAKDIYTSGHSQRVMIIATTIARELGLSENEIEEIRVASLVHDIGKIGVKESVLNKPGRLSGEEYEHIKMHCEIGERILKPVINSRNILRIVRHHHERFDGKGYPDGLRGDDIPRGARIIKVADSFDAIADEFQDARLTAGTMIVAVADAYDAMTTDRPYRNAMDPVTASREMAKQRGEQFDPVIFDAFLGLLEKNNWFSETQLPNPEEVKAGE
jgi:HD-GYP domain-containing protein (c-di-GMP phosphodiesterase class II)